MSRNYGAVVLGPATLSLTTWLVLICRRLVGRRTYLWGQCGKFGDRSLKRRLQEVMNRLATGLLVYGENEAVAATQLGLSRGRVHIVHNATRSNADVVARDDSATQFVRLQEAAEAARSRGEVTFLYVGRLNQDKRISVLLQAAERLRSSGFEAVSVDLIGDGDAKAELEAAYPHDWVRFHGWVFDSDELSGFFERATFVCSPWDMGLVAIDALRSGTPVLVPDNPRNGPEVEALTAGVNAALFTPGEPESLVAAARGWLDSVERIDLDRYRGSRIDALAVWDPASVAKAISRAVTP
jgi:glycosyltransferase involved in cell wall biosynthesis